MAFVILTPQIFAKKGIFSYLVPSKIFANFRLQLLLTRAMKKVRCKTVANCLRKYRKARGLKQKEIAQILGMRNPSVISRWEQGVCLPNLKNAFKLAVLYRTMTDALFLEMREILKEELLKREGMALSNKTKGSHA